MDEKFIKLYGTRIKEQMGLEDRYLVPLAVYPDDSFELSRSVQEFQFTLPFQHFMPKYTREGSEFEIWRNQ